MFAGRGRMYRGSGQERRVSAMEINAQRQVTARAVTDFQTGEPGVP